MRAADEKHDSNKQWPNQLRSLYPALHVPKVQLYCWQTSAHLQLQLCSYTTIASLQLANYATFETHQLYSLLIFTVIIQASHLITQLYSYYYEATSSLSIFNQTSRSILNLKTRSMLQVWYCNIASYSPYLQYKEFCVGRSKAKTVLYFPYSTARCEQCYIIIIQNRIRVWQRAGRISDGFPQPIQRWIRQ